jgi:hypothetical protein
LKSGNTWLLENDVNQITLTKRGKESNGESTSTLPGSDIENEIIDWLEQIHLGMYATKFI